MEPNPASSSKQKSKQRVFKPSRPTNLDLEQEQNAKAVSDVGTFWNLIFMRIFQEKETIELMKQMSLNPSATNMQKVNFFFSFLFWRLFFSSKTSTFSPRFFIS